MKSLTGYMWLCRAIPVCDILSVRASHVDEDGYHRKQVVHQTHRSENNLWDEIDGRDEVDHHGKQEEDDPEPAAARHPLQREQLLQNVT